MADADNEIVERKLYHSVAVGVASFVASPWVFVALGVLLLAVVRVFHTAASATVAIELAAFAIVVLIHARARATERAMHEKLDALTEGVAALLDHVQDDSTREHAQRIRRAEDAAGLEKDL
jgi:low affinity Fe/Cu permease